MELYQYINWLTNADASMVRMVSIVLFAAIIGYYIYLKQKKNSKDV